MQDIQFYVNLSYSVSGVLFIGLCLWVKLSLNNAQKTLQKIKGQE